MDFDASVAWPVYDWMGVAKAALEATSRYLARDLGPRGVRVNLVSAGPIGTIAARGIPGFSQLADAWQKQAPLGWSTDDAGPVAGAVCFLLSDLARAITAEILHVDGGFHAMGTPLEGMDGTAERPLEEAPRRELARSCSPAPRASSAWRCSRGCSSAPTARCCASSARTTATAAEQRLDDVLAKLYSDASPLPRARARARRAT